MLDPDDDGGTRDLPLHQLGSLAAQVFAVAISLWALGLSCSANRNTLELARQNHLPIWKCALEGGGLTIENRGGAARRLSVDRFAIFTAVPMNDRGLGQTQMFLMPDYFSEEVRRYDGDNLVLTLSAPPGGAKLAGTISAAIQRAMNENNARWGWIETYSYARIECEDLLGVKLEQFYARDRESGHDFARVTEERWRAADHLRDSLGSARTVVVVRDADSTDVARVVQACIAALP